MEGGAGRDSDSLRPTALSSLAPLPPPSPHVGGGRGRGSGGGDNHELIRKVELVLQQFQNIEVRCLQSERRRAYVQVGRA